MKEAKDIQYTIRGIDEELDEVIRVRAKKRGLSLNSYIVSALEESHKLDKKPLHDLSWIAGSWVEDPEFDKIMAELRTVDPRDWE